MIFPADDLLLEEPKPTALYAAAASAAAANAWTSVNGWVAARSYTSIEEEYEAASSGAGIVDFGPIIRYSARGADAAAMLSRATSAPVAGLVPGESARGLMLDEDGAVVDIIEAARLSDDLYLLAATRPHARRLQLASRGFDVAIEEITGRVTALAIVGPKAREVASAIGVDSEGDFLARQSRVRGVEASARPIHYGALGGVEVIYPYEEALTVWERLRRARAPKPIGLDALEIFRIEGGAPRPGIDFTLADEAQRPAQKRLPDEIGLPHLAPTASAWFNGRRALKSAAQSRRALVVLAVDASAAAAGAAVFAGKTAVGRIASWAFSPRLRRVIAFADIGREAFGKALEVAMPGDGEPRAAAAFFETPESRLAGAFRAAEKSATESRR